MVRQAVTESLIGKRLVHICFGMSEGEPMGKRPNVNKYKGGAVVISQKQEKGESE